MAGIGFVLRKLARQDDLLSTLKGYTHSTIVSVGPWLITILSIGCINLFGSKLITLEELANFRMIIIYNFAFSLVFSGPVLWVVTRYIADLIYSKEVKEIPGVMLGSLALIYGTQIFIVAPFYLFYVNLDLEIRLAALVNFFLISGIWLVSIFLSALKDYGFIVGSYAIGMILGTILTILLTSAYSVAGMISGFSVGLAVVMFSLITRIFTEYPYPATRLFGFLGFFKKYWDLALAGLVYNLAIWVDKWIMWFSPERVEFASGMISYPNYNSAMFLAYLSIIPSMAQFIISIETNFYEHYLKFYGGIQLHDTHARIQRNQRAILGSIMDSSRNFLILQGSITYVVLLLSSKIFNLLDINFLQIGIFRFGVIGAFFFAMMSFLSIILTYFDLRRVVLSIYLLFLITNIVFTYVSMKLGFAYYGFGYFLASLVTFAVTYLVVVHYTKQLPYIAFVRNNSSVQ